MFFPFAVLHFFSNQFNSYIYRRSFEPLYIPLILHLLVTYFLSACLSACLSVTRRHLSGRGVASVLLSARRDSRPSLIGWPSRDAVPVFSDQLLHSHFFSRGAFSVPPSACLRCVSALRVCVACLRVCVSVLIAERPLQSRPPSTDERLAKRCRFLYQLIWEQGGGDEERLWSTASFL